MVTVALWRIRAKLGEKFPWWVVQPDYLGEIFWDHKVERRVEGRPRNWVESGE